MGTPNEFMPSALYRYQQGQASPYPHQTTPHHANFAQCANNGAQSYYNNNNGGFFANPLNHNFHANSARLPCFNAPTFAQSERQSDNSMSMYNSSAPHNTVYWSQQQQHQASPFGVLPHEIAVDRSRMYNAQNVPFASSRASLNPTEAEKTLVESHERYMPKPIADIRQNCLPYNSNNLPYCNGVINHATAHSIEESNELADDIKHEPVCDYRMFPDLNTGEASSGQFASQLKQILRANLPFDGMSRPALTTDFHDTSQSAPRIQPDMSKYQNTSRSSPRTTVSNHNPRKSPALSHNRANAVSQANLPSVYRDTQSVNCRATEENGVTSSFSKLPFTTSSSANVNLDQSLYAPYNNSTSSTFDSQSKEFAEQSTSAFSARNNFLIKMNDIGEMDRSKVITTSNNDVGGYPSVIVRTDQYFENNEKSESSTAWQPFAHQVSPAGPNFSEPFQMSDQRARVNALPEQPRTIAGPVQQQYQYAPPAAEPVGKPKSKSEKRKTSKTEVAARPSSNQIAEVRSSPVHSEVLHAASPQDNSAPVNLPSSNPSSGSTQTSSMIAPSPRPPSASVTESSGDTQASAASTAAEGMTKNGRVVVPDIEEEFKFLFDPALPNYALIIADEGMIRAVDKPGFYRKNNDFLSSYVKFLENNCVSLERLTVGNSSETKSSFRGKPLLQSSARDGEISASTSAQEEEEHCDLDYPLVRTTNQRRLRQLTDTSDDEEREPCRSPTEAKKNEEVLKSETESEDAGRAKKKKHRRDMAKKTASKRRKTSNEVHWECELSDGASTAEEWVGRKVSLRKAKVDVQERIKRAVETDDEESSNSDSSWSPLDYDSDESVSARKSSRVRVVRSVKKLPEPHSSAAKDARSELTGGRNRGPSETNVTSDDVGSFFVQKKQLGSKKHPLWRLDGGRLQKFEHKNRDGKRVFSSVPQFVKVSNSRLNRYERVDVRVVNRSKGCLTVELHDEMDELANAQIRDDFMKESSRYESQFAVYVQTLVSQALDSTFLNEIFRENDTYFLDNIQVIEDVTATYVNDLSSVMKCDSPAIDVLMRTWPFLSIETRNHDSYRAGEDACACCRENNACKTAIFYGQPYKRETLQGSTTNIPNNIDKTADLCKGCANQIQLFNKIWHQKYHLFVECAKCVSKKKGLNRNKVTTAILDELLADDLWLSRLFHDIRNTWLMVWTMVQKTRKKLYNDDDA